MSICRFIAVSICFQKALLAIELTIKILDVNSLPITVGFVSIYDERNKLVYKSKNSGSANKFSWRASLGPGVYRVVFETSATYKTEYSMENVHLRAGFDQRITLRPFGDFPGSNASWGLSKLAVQLGSLKGTLFFRAPTFRTNQFSRVEQTSRFSGTGLSITSHRSICSSPLNTCEFETAVIVDCDQFEWRGDKATLSEKEVLVYAGSQLVGRASINKFVLTCQAEK